MAGPANWQLRERYRHGDLDPGPCPECGERNWAPGYDDGRDADYIGFQCRNDGEIVGVDVSGESTDPFHEVVVAADLYTMVHTDQDAVEAVPWVYLRCKTDRCPWWLGFDREATIADLASAAKQHEYEGEAWRRRRESLIDDTEAEGHRP